jgi:hypothetical protein
MCSPAALASELSQLGFRLAPSEVARRVSVRDVLGGEQQGRAELRLLAEIADTGLPLCLSATDLGKHEHTITQWQKFCEAIQAALARRRTRSAPPAGFCIHSHQLPLEAYCLITDVVLGKGPRYVFLDGLQMGAHCSRPAQQRAAANWNFLWRNRTSPRPVMPVYGGLVKSTCPLLSDEVAATVMPATGLHVPANTAWLGIELRLTHFADGAGRLEEGRLYTALRRAVRIADFLLEQQAWPCPMQRADATANRRLAFRLSGIGDLVVMSGRNPRDLDCLHWLGGILRRIRRSLYATSVRIAEQRGALPAIMAAYPIAALPEGPHRDAWQKRFAVAARKAAIRHRNILVISPYAVLPGDLHSKPAFTDLLPLIAIADAWSFADPPAFTRWNITEFSQFHRRARAVIQGSQAASFIAAGV